MAEAIHCPSCSTRYRLSPERVKPSIRRARCFSCDRVFPVGDAVQRLLGKTPVATASFDREAVAAALAHAPAAPSSLTLGDLEGADAEILERTLVDVPLVLPEIKAEAAPARPPIPAPPVAPPTEVGQNTLTGGYSSARDAINKLFDGVPAMAEAPKGPKEASAMDMEATLSALEATLSGPDALPDSISNGDAPTASGRLPGISQAPTTATVRLSQEELQAALRAGTPEEPTQAPPPVNLPQSSILKTAPEELAEKVPPPAPRVEILERAPKAVEDPGVEQLRLKIGEEIYPGLTMTQLAAWVEEGRILEHHLVARQHSENWLEAHKVPGLRPAFERQRRERSGGASSLDPNSQEIAPKKSLFGGIFGKS